jgi:hypothetical protein
MINKNRETRAAFCSCENRHHNQRADRERSNDDRLER